MVARREYLTIGQIYVQDNPLLRETLRPGRPLTDADKASLAGTA
jgi:hypothetical protein